MSCPQAADLCRGLFDDASMFPPESQALKDALRVHIRHRLSWYGDMVGSLVCQASRLTSLNELTERSGIDRVEVSMVIPEGLPRVPIAMAAAARSSRVEVRAIELPLGTQPLADALKVLTPLVTSRRAVFLEIAASAVTEAAVHRLAPSGVRLKLRAGGTSLDAFRPESDVARVIVLCAAERLAFKCSAGLHHALRHRDPDTFLHHHGFLNIALAARIAGATGSAKATEAMLADVNPRSIAYHVGGLEPTDIRAIRALLSCVATFSVGDSVADLVELGLIAAQ